MNTYNRKRLQTIILSLLMTLAVFAGTGLRAKAEEDASAHFHAVITGSLTEYASESTALYSVKYTVDQEAVSEGDYIYVSVPKCVAESAEFSVDPQHFCETECVRDSGSDLIYKLTFGRDAQTALVGSFSMFIRTASVETKTTGKVKAGNSTADLTVLPKGKPGEGTAYILAKDTSGDRDMGRDTLDFGGYDYTDGCASMISVLKKKADHISYRLFVGDPSRSLSDITVTDTFPEGMHYDASREASAKEDCRTSVRWENGEALDESTYALNVTEHGLTFRYYGSGYPQDKIVVKYTLYFDEDETPELGRYQNRAEMKYTEDGSEYSITKGAAVQGSRYSAANGVKSADKSVISCDPDDQIVTYTIKFWNSSGFGANEICLTDNLDEHVRFVGAAENEYFSVKQTDEHQLVIANKKAIEGRKTVYVQFTTDFSDVPAGYTVSNTVGGNTTKTFKEAGAYLHAEKTVDGRDPAADEQFSFALRNVTVEENGSYTEEEKPIQTVTNSGRDIDFDVISYKNPGTYWYSIREAEDGCTAEETREQDETAGYIYDERVFFAEVTVNSDAAADVKYYLVTDHGLEEEEPVFRNTAIQKPVYSGLLIRKTDGDTNELIHARFGLYADQDCTEQVKEFDADGEYELTAEDLNDYLPQDDSNTFLYLKEIQAPEGYSLSDEVYTIRISRKEAETDTSAAEEEKETEEAVSQESGDEDSESTSDTAAEETSEETEEDVSQQPAEENVSTEDIAYSVSDAPAEETESSEQKDETPADPEALTDDSEGNKDEEPVTEPEENEGSDTETDQKAEDAEDDSEEEEIPVQYVYTVTCNDDTVLTVANYKTVPVTPSDEKTDKTETIPWTDLTPSEEVTPTEETDKTETVPWTELTPSEEVTPTEETDKTETVPWTELTPSEEVTPVTPTDEETDRTETIPWTDLTPSEPEEVMPHTYDEASEDILPHTDDVSVKEDQDTVAETEEVQPAENAAVNTGVSAGMGRWIAVLCGAVGILAVLKKHHD